LEHSWGRNIPEQGLGNLGASLAARIRSGFGVGLWLTNIPFSSGAVFVDIPLLVDAPYTFHGAGTVPGFPHFPYGLDVAPDVHM
jgi:hypothetical protein